MITALRWFPTLLLSPLWTGELIRLSAACGWSLLVGITLGAAVTGWTLRPWQPPILRRQVRACGVSFGLLCLHEALASAPLPLTAQLTELALLTCLLALWLPTTRRRAERRRAGRPAAATSLLQNRAMPLSPLECPR